jgi:hypothetical protein
MTKAQPVLGEICVAHCATPCESAWRRCWSWLSKPPPRLAALVNGSPSSPPCRIIAVPWCAADAGSSPSIPQDWAGEVTGRRPLRRAWLRGCSAMRCAYCALRRSRRSRQKPERAIHRRFRAKAPVQFNSSPGQRRGETRSNFSKPRRGDPTLAQGNALGHGTPFQQALKGRSNPDPRLRHALARPFRAFIRLPIQSQGVAPG